MSKYITVLRTFGSRGDSPEQMNYPRGVAIDDADNIYVSSWHKLQKFTSSGELIKCVGQKGSKEGEWPTWSNKHLNLQNQRNYDGEHIIPAAVTTNLKTAF